MNNVKVRKADVESLSTSSRYTSYFDKCKISSSSNEKVVSMKAKKSYQKGEGLFDKVNLENSDVDSKEIGISGYEDGKTIEKKKITTDAIVTENGGLDACIVINGKEYMLSDYKDYNPVDKGNDSIRFDHFRGK